MFERFKKKNNTTTSPDSYPIYAPLSGTAISLSEVTDPVFSQKMVGDGMAIIPTDGKVYAPVDGSLIQVFKTHHAYAIRTDYGAEILIHCGLDTVSLGGKGFTPHKKTGETVQKGELLVEMDLAFLTAQDKDLTTPIVITNMDNYQSIQGESTEIKVGELLFTLKK